MMTPSYYIPPSGILAGSSIGLVVGNFVKKEHLRMREIKPIFNYMYDKKHFEGQKFVCIMFFFYHGIKTDLTPVYKGIHRTEKDLAMGVELDTLILDWADKNNPELLKEIYLIALCEGILHALRKYKLPTESVETIRSKLGTIPLTIEECQTWKQKIPLTPEAILGYTPPPWPTEQG